MNSHKILMIRMKGLLISCSVPAFECDRGTADCPAKSQIVGMLGGGMGMKRNDTEMIRRLAEMSLTVFILNQGVLLEDFQTVKPDFENGLVVSDISGGLRKKGITRRKSYLSDADFIACVEGDSALLHACALGLDNPVYTPFLGRASCFPSRPVCAGVFDNSCEAYDKVDELMTEYKKEEVEYEEDCDIASATDFRLDYPVCFGEEAKYARRPVCRNMYRKGDRCEDSTS